jgi:N-acetylglucosaminyldiphosphoundecaprenol N-acetyl-beta-D-mannosaminyltransferase
LTSAPARSRRVSFLGCPLDLITSGQLLEELAQAIDTRAGSRVIQFVNGNKVAQVREDPGMGEILQRADYVLADGQPILPMGRMLGIRIPERIDGIGLMGKLLRLAHARGYAIYLLGAKQNVLEACVARIRRDHPGIKIAGYRNGYFSPAEAGAVVHQIRAAQADLLFLGMGTPMKERFADTHSRDLGVTVIQGVGGSFDVMAGIVNRAPRWIQRIGFEWLYRVVQEPRRMAWRYVKTNAICLWAFALAWLGGGRGTGDRGQKSEVRS